MEALATPQLAPAWVCPECGHGSPEPRDRLPHLDAHRQLKAFLDDWDAAAKADQAAEDAAAPLRRRRPYAYGAVAVLVLLLAAVAVRLAGSDRGGAPAVRGPVPAVELPGYDVQPAPDLPPAQVTEPPATPAVGGDGIRQAPPATTGPEPTATPAVTVPQAASGDGSVVPPAATTRAEPVPTVTGAGVPTTPPSPPAAVPAPVVVNLCLVGVCLATTG